MLAEKWKLSCLKQAVTAALSPSSASNSQVRIGGGVYPDIVEADYLAGGTDYRIDAQGTKTMHSSLMYRLCYHE